MIFYNKKLQVFTSTLFSEVSAGFGTRFRGDGRTDKNIPFKNIVRMKQVHGADIYEYMGDGAGIEEADGLTTSVKGKCLLALTADCVPILFFSREKRIIGISHQGWRGLLAQLPKKMVERLGRDTVAAIGPAINDCCYNIEKDRYEVFKKQFPQEVFHKVGDKISLNLARLSYLQLQEAGIPEKNIDHFPFCTACDQDRFFSYRKMKNKEDFPRQFNYVSLS